MALVLGENSYATVAEADEYFADRPDADVWGAVTNKAAFLILATDTLDKKRWGGQAVDPDQPLSFPRTGTYFDPKVGAIIDFPSGIPERIKIATIELSLFLSNNPDIASGDVSGGVSEIKVGPIELKGLQPTSTSSKKVKELTSCMLSSNGGAGGLWFRVN